MVDADAGRRFDVAFSLASEQRALVERIASELRGRGRSVFFYGWPEFVAELAAPDLDVQLRRIYGEETRLLVPVLSKEWARKPWCGVVEGTVIRELIFDRRNQGLMMLRVDSTPIEGISKLHGYLDVAGRSAEELAGLIELRLAQNGLIELRLGPKDHTLLPLDRNWPSGSLELLKAKGLQIVATWAVLCGVTALAFRVYEAKLPWKGMMILYAILAIAGWQLAALIGRRRYASRAASQLPKSPASPK